MEGVKIVATNRKATHDYTIEDRLEAGVILQGTEVKSIRAGQVNLREGYVQIRDGEAFLLNTHISPYDPSGGAGHDPLRTRKLLLNRKEITKLNGALQERGWTIIPLRMYFKNGRVKLEIGLARGKRKYDKRQTIAKRDAQRQIERTMKDRG